MHHLQLPATEINHWTVSPLGGANTASKGFHQNSSLLKNNSKNNNLPVSQSMPSTTQTNNKRKVLARSTMHTKFPSIASPKISNSQVESLRSSDGMRGSTGMNCFPYEMSKGEQAVAMKMSDQHTMIYKQKVMKQNQVIKMRLFKNAEQDQTHLGFAQAKSSLDNSRSTSIISGLQGMRILTQQNNNNNEQTMSLQRQTIQENNNSSLFIGKNTSTAPCVEAPSLAVSYQQQLLQVTTRLQDTQLRMYGISAKNKKNINLFKSSNNPFSSSNPPDLEQLKNSQVILSNYSTLRQPSQAVVAPVTQQIKTNNPFRLLEVRGSAKSNNNNNSGYIQLLSVNGVQQGNSNLLGSSLPSSISTSSSPLPLSNLKSLLTGSTMTGSAQPSESIGQLKGIMEKKQFKEDRDNEDVEAMKGQENTVKRGNKERVKFRIHGEGEGNDAEEAKKNNGKNNLTENVKVLKDDCNLAVEVLRESFSSYDEDENESGLEEDQYNSEEEYEQLQNSGKDEDKKEIQNEEEEKDIEKTINFKEQQQRERAEKRVISTIIKQNTKAQSHTSNTYAPMSQHLTLTYKQQEHSVHVQNQSESILMDVFDEDSCNGKYNWRINDVLIGAGSMGRIYKVFCSKAVKNFALKVIQLRDGSFEGDEAKHAINEMLILRRLRKQPEVIQLYDAFALEKSSFKAIVLVLEYCTCNLLEIARFRKSTSKPWTEEQLMCIFKQLLDGVESLKSKNVCHRDIKTQNILYSSIENRYKLGDFSESKVIEHGHDPQQQESEQQQPDEGEHSFRGTIKFLSPELSVAMKHNQDVCLYSPYLSDLYSLGILFVDLLVGQNIMFQVAQQQSIDAEKNKEKEKNKNNHNKNNHFSANKIYLNTIIDFCKQSIAKNVLPAACAVILSLLNEVPSQRTEYKRLMTNYELRKDIRHTQGGNDKEIALVIETKREDQINASQIKRAEKLFVIAQGYKRILKLDQAIEEYKQAMQVVTTMKTKTIRSKALFQIGKCYQRLGQFKNSLEFYQDCCNFRKQIYKPESRRMGEALNALGIANYKLGNYLEAEKQYEESLKIAEKKYGERHVVIASMYNNLGSVNFSLHRFNEAISNFKKSMDILKAIRLDKSIPETLSNLSMVYAATKDIPAAKKGLLSAEEQTIQYFGKDSSKLINIYKNLGQIFSLSADKASQDSIEQAIEYLLKAEALIASHYGTDHYTLPEVYNLLGDAFVRKGDYTKASEYLLNNLEQLQKSNNFAALCQTYSSLAALEGTQSHFDKAQEYFQKILDLSEEINLDEIKQADYNYNIACLCLYQNNAQESLVYFYKALSLYKNNDDDHPNIPIIETNIAKINNNQR